MELAPAIAIEDATVLCGTCSWTDKTLVKEANWYPKKSMKAAERLAFYAAHFPIVEVDSTYYFPPTPEVAQTWVDRTPDGFTMNIKAWSLLTGHPTFPNSLWPDLQDDVRHDLRDKRNLYKTHLTDAALAESWARFRHAISPLHEAGRLGAVLMQFPKWFHPGETRRAELRRVRTALPEYRICVEFRNAAWMDNDECENTLAFLEDTGLAYVCVDEPQGYPSSVPPVVAATNDLAVVRFHGQNTGTWDTDEDLTPAERFCYRYSTPELAAWVPKIRELAASADEVHVLMNNCYRDFGVDNAAEMATLLATR